MPRNIRPRQNMLERILATPQLARVVPRLEPELLHRLIRHCGLDDCGELLALATPGQVARLFDLDLWRAPSAGRDEQFDAGRFAEWLEVMMDAGAGHAAATLAALDSDLLAAGFAEHVRVFDHAAVAPYQTLDGDVAPGAPFADGVRSEIGGYVVTPKRTDFWEVMTHALGALADAQGECFKQIMRGCCRLSSSRPEVDGLDDLLAVNDQAMLDAALDREARGDARGYVTPGQARAFLQMARRLDLRAATRPPRDAMTRAYFTHIDAQLIGLPASEPVASRPDDAVAAFVELLHDAGVMPRPPRALLEAPRQTDEGRLARIRARLRVVAARDAVCCARRDAELAYLANVVAAGAAIQSRAITNDEAADAAMAVCNLGLENWPFQWLPRDDDVPDDFLIDHDLVSVFQVGWAVLHEEVCMFVADTLAGVLASLRCIDTDIQDALETLRTRLTKQSRAGTPWEVRDALDVIAILDPPSWAALAGLLDQLPTVPAALDASLARTTRRIDPSAFEFIADNAQIQKIRDFMRLLPERLR